MMVRVRKRAGASVGGRVARKAYRSIGGNIVLFGILAAMGAFMVLPLFYAVISAFKPLEEFFIFPPRFYVINPTTDNFTQLFAVTANLWMPFSRYLFNSAMICVVSTAGNLFLSSMAAYVLAKHEFKGKSVVWSIIIISLLFTSRVMSIPQYLVFAGLGLIDTIWVIVLPSIGMTLGVFLMKQFMEGIPTAILESARIDGAGEFRICWQVVMPSVKPAWITMIIFVFQNVWNSTGGNMIYTESKKVLPTILTQISASGMVRAGVGSAAALILLIPPVLVFVFAQSRIMETMASSGVK